MIESAEVATLSSNAGSAVKEINKSGFDGTYRLDVEPDVDLTEMNQAEKRDVAERVYGDNPGASVDTIEGAAVFRRSK